MRKNRENGFAAFHKKSGISIGFKRLCSRPYSVRNMVVHALQVNRSHDNFQNYVDDFNKSRQYISLRREEIPHIHFENGIPNATESLA